MQKFKIGDRVFSYTLQRWGTVERKVATSKIIITVYFDILENKRIYEEDGRLSPADKAPDLFYDEVTITPPLKPLPDLKGCSISVCTSYSDPSDIYVWENQEIVKEKEN